VLTIETIGALVSTPQALQVLLDGVDLKDGRYEAASQEAVGTRVAVRIECLIDGNV
jgi:hypothetical protein